MTRLIFYDYYGYYFSLFLHKNLGCGYSKELPWQSDSNDHPQNSFQGEITKIISSIITKYMYVVFMGILF